MISHKLPGVIFHQCFRELFHKDHSSPQNALTIYALTLAEYRPYRWLEVSINLQFLMAQWLEQVSQEHEMYCLEIMGSNPSKVELEVSGPYASSRLQTKNSLVRVYLAQQFWPLQAVTCGILWLINLWSLWTEVYIMNETFDKNLCQPCLWSIKTNHFLEWRSDWLNEWSNQMVYFVSIKEKVDVR